MGPWSVLEPATEHTCWLVVADASPEVWDAMRDPLRTSGRMRLFTCAPPEDPDPCVVVCPGPEIAHRLRVASLIPMGAVSADLLQGCVGAEVLTGTECALLNRLHLQPGQPVARETLYRDVWGFRSTVQTRALDTAVRRTRQKLQAAGATATIRTVRGMGYALHVPPASASPAPLPVPAATTRSSPDCMGREDAFAELDALRVRGARVVAIVGPGGVGKSTLARTWTASTSRTLVDLAEGSSPLHALADALDLTGASVEQVATALAERPGHLVLIDNVERDVEACDALARALPGPVLLTSRVASAAADATLRLDGLSEEAGVALFRSRALSSDASAAVEPELRELIRLLDGHPLSIVLAASRAGVLTPGQMVEHMGRTPLGLLRDPNHRGPDRHARLEEVFAASWTGLDDALQTTLGALAWFAHPQPVEVLEQVLGLDALDAAQELHTRSLVQTRRARGERVLQLPEALRAFVLGRRGADAPEVERCWSYLRERSLGSRTRWPDLAELDRALREREDERMRAAWAVLCAERGDTATALGVLGDASSPHLAAARGVVLAARGEIDEALRAFEHATPLLPEFPEWQAERGVARLRHGDLPGATLDLETAVATLERRGDRTRAALWRSRLAWVHHRAGRAGDAEHLLRAALETLPPDSEPAIRTAVNLAHLLASLGRLSEAGCAVADLEPRGLPTSLAVQLTSLHAMLAIEAGDTARARRTTDLAATTAARAGQRSTMWIIRLNLVSLLLTADALQEAEALLRAALQDPAVTQNPRIGGQAWCLEGVRHQLLGQLDEAADAWARGLDLLGSADDARHARMRLVHATLIARRGDTEGAVRVLDDLGRSTWPEIHDAVRTSLRGGTVPPEVLHEASASSAGRIVLRLLRSPPG